MNTPLNRTHEALYARAQAQIHRDGQLLFAQQQRIATLEERIAELETTAARTPSGGGAGELVGAQATLTAARCMRRLAALISQSDAQVVGATLRVLVEMADALASDDLRAPLPDDA